MSAQIDFFLSLSVVARVLIVGCGCRGSALAEELARAGHAVRGTSRTTPPGPPVEGVVADPSRLATLTPHLEGVTVVCWLLATADDPDLHGPRLATILEWIVDTPVRGFVYEAAGGEDIVRRAGDTWQIPVEVVRADPAGHDEWLEAMTAAVAAVLAR